MPLETRRYMPFRYAYRYLLKGGQKATTQATLLILSDTSKLESSHVVHRSKHGVDGR